MREKLIKLIDEAINDEETSYSNIADYLLENGVIVPPMPMTKELHKELVDYVYKRCIDEL